MQIAHPTTAAASFLTPEQSSFINEVGDALERLADINQRQSQEITSLILKYNKFTGGFKK